MEPLNERPGAVDRRADAKPAHPTPDDPPWNSWVAVAVWLGSVVLLVIFSNLFLVPYLATRNFALTDQAALNTFLQTDSTAIFLRILSVLPAHLVTFLVCWLVVTRFRRYDFRQTLGWDLGRFRIWQAIAISLLFYALAAVVTQLFGDIENEFEVMLKSARWAIVPLIIMAVGTAPIVEEVVYRGVLYSALQRRFGKIFAIGMVTVLFAAVHAVQYSQDATPDYATMSVLLLLSLTLTSIRAYTGNLLPCILLHIVFNAGQSALIVVYKLFLEEMETTVESATLFLFT